MKSSLFFPVAFYVIKIGKYDYRKKNACVLLI